MTTPIDVIQDVADMLYRKGSICDFGIDERQLPQMIELAFTRYRWS